VKQSSLFFHVILSSQAPLTAMHRGRARYGPGARPQLMLLLLHILQYVSTLPFLPIITLTTIGLLVLIHLGAAPRPFGCITASAVLARGLLSQRSWSTMLGSAVTHADDTHLLLNSLSLLHKGVQLEAKYGKLQLLLLLLALVPATQLAYVGVALAGSLLQPSLYSQCAVGFSGVIFALKVVCQASPGLAEEYVHGMRVPAKLAAWAELILISVLSPNASFIGHLAGILVGLAVVALQKLPAFQGLRQLLLSAEQLLERAVAQLLQLLQLPAPGAGQQGQQGQGWQGAQPQQRPAGARFWGSGAAGTRSRD
jgi:membrane associated rhomboid family serine protease